MRKIHPTAVISSEAYLDNDVEVGAYSLIMGRVKIGRGSRIFNNVTIVDNTEIGRGNQIFSGAVIGSQPQDLKYKGERAFLKIGDNNIIREFVTINPGTMKNSTRVGNDNLIMAYSHIAHDCHVGNHCVFANNATLAGHVIIEDGVVIGGLSAIHQYVRVGKLAIIGGCSKVVQDIPPFSTCDGHPARIFGINSVGLKRAGICQDTINQLKSSFKILFHSGLSLKNAVKQIKNKFKNPSQELIYLLAFIKDTQRGLTR